MRGGPMKVFVEVETEGGSEDGDFQKVLEVSMKSIFKNILLFHYPQRVHQAVESKKPSPEF